MAHQVIGNAALKAMMQCEERGDFLAMRVHLRDAGNSVANVANPHELREFARLLMRVVQALDIEHEHGPRFLMKWDHPFNCMMAERGVIQKPMP